MPHELDELHILRPMDPARTPATARDAELLAAWRAGDRRSGERLFGRHFDQVRRFFRRRVPPSEIGDLVQLTFEVCLHVQPQYRAQGSFGAYLLTIARTQLHRWRRRRDPIRGAIAPWSLAEHGASPSDVVAGRERGVLLRECLCGIPREMKDLLELHYWEELDIAELAERLGILPGAARVRLFRARARLRAELAARQRHASTTASVLPPAPHEAARGNSM